MIKFLKLLSILLILPCPFSGMLMIGLLFESAQNDSYYWLLIFPTIGYMIVSLWFFFKMHRRGQWANSWKLFKANDAIGVFDV